MKLSPTQRAVLERMAKTEWVLRDENESWSWDRKPHTLLRRATTQILASLGLIEAMPNSTGYTRWIYYQITDAGRAALQEPPG